ncbi:MAG: NHL repeat-containing protein [Candidatus Sericytochromatia bacterium]
MDRRQFLKLSGQLAVAAVAVGAWAPAAKAAILAPRGLVRDPIGRQPGFDVNLAEHTVSRLDASGQVRWTVGGLGEGPGQLNGPSAVATDAEGQVYVLDRGNRRVQLFDAEGRFRSAFDLAGSPRDLAVAAPGRVVVADARGHVRCYENGREAWASDAIGRPVAVAVDAHGQIHTVDALGCRVVVLDRHGRELSSYGRSGQGPGRFRAPRAIACGDGQMAILDGMTGEVHVFSAGKLVDHHASKGHAVRIAWADGAWRLGA